jgi:hypothetical protein
VIRVGSQGEVVFARDIVHDRLVALKIRDVRSAIDREALLTEARTLLNLRLHPSVPLVRDDFTPAAGNGALGRVHGAKGPSLLPVRTPGGFAQRGQARNRAGRPGSTTSTTGEVR